jgi:DNA replication protein DnaC
MQAEPATWQEILASSLRQISTRRSEPSGLAKLSLSARPRRQHKPQISRTIAEVDKTLREALRATAFGELPWPLFIHGPAGTGKTCAALSLLDHAGGEYFTSASLCEKVIDAQQERLSWSHEGRSGILWPEMFWRAIAREPLVVLDELGTRDKVSDHGYETIKRLLDERQGRPLIAISNHSLETLERIYDDRVASRLATGTVVELQGADRRLIEDLSQAREAS